MATLCFLFPNWKVLSSKMFTAFFRATCRRFHGDLEPCKCPCVHIRSRLPGLSPASGTFPGNLIWTLAIPVIPPNLLGPGTKDWPWARNWYRAAVFIKCAHARIVVARWPYAQPVRTAETTQPYDCPREAGAFDDSVDMSVVKKIRPLQTVPGKRGPSLNAGCVIPVKPFCNYGPYLVYPFLCNIIDMKFVKIVWHLSRLKVLNLYANVSSLHLEFVLLNYS